MFIIKQITCLWHGAIEVNPDSSTAAQDSPWAAMSLRKAKPKMPVLWMWDEIFLYLKAFSNYSLFCSLLTANLTHSMFSTTWRLQSLITVEKMRFGVETWEMTLAASLVRLMHWNRLRVIIQFENLKIRCQSWTKVT